jgi:hypothetical protein
VTAPTLDGMVPMTVNGIMPKLESDDPFLRASDAALGGIGKVVVGMGNVVGTGGALAGKVLTSGAELASTAVNTAITAGMAAGNTVINAGAGALTTASSIAMLPTSMLGAPKSM